MDTVDENAVKEWADKFRAYYDLSGDAECASPDRHRDDPDGPSAGYLLLESVRDGVIELVTNADEIPADVSDWDYDGRVHEIADAAPDVYTHRRWAEFVDLAAYDEDVTELGADVGDLTVVAGVALYMIAERLCWAMLNDLHEMIAEARDAAEDAEG